MNRVTAGRVCYTSGPRVMFNIGFGELAIICIVLIIAVGPERLPSMMKTLGKTIRTLRQASRDIRASTGIDELLREDFDLYSPPSPPRPRPAYVPPTPDPAAPALVNRQDPVELPADATPAPPATEAAPAPQTPAEAVAAAAAMIGGFEPQSAPASSAEPASPQTVQDEQPKQSGSG
jgi:sec-independent protein translocase protein TatB